MRYAPASLSFCHGATGPVPFVTRDGSVEGNAAIMYEDSLRCYGSGGRATMRCAATTAMQSPSTGRHGRYASTFDEYFEARYFYTLSHRCHRLHRGASSILHVGTGPRSACGVGRQWHRGHCRYAACQPSSSQARRQGKVAYAAAAGAAAQAGRRGWAALALPKAVAPGLMADDSTLMDADDADGPRFLPTYPPAAWAPGVGARSPHIPALKRNHRRSVRSESPVAGAWSPGRETQTPRAPSQTGGRAPSPGAVVIPRGRQFFVSPPPSVLLLRPLLPWARAANENHQPCGLVPGPQRGAPPGLGGGRGWWNLRVRGTVFSSLWM
ncbi:hypothetical protein VFPFJ_00312 [Purpureocillium lilacinum]|uniref:Uncharacterized protein n=1 Tax=Purpureocillium lilacinum TaxID=33203 RepID=A0A179H8I8_PURLI|nr:hypothetical protein VFPFJ_00312 [Purpureocillium lilacinum]OAQ86242.1 hypothetical protein VFPBJ_00282 [Purpureocillium lilacinum]OAQ94203.1 hypothetical protein VFPFJ_00312 [Purpureocillium lilacinum]